MSATISDQDLLHEMVTFIQHRIPGLEAGEYTLDVSQRVADSAGKPIDDGSLHNTYSFAVLGDRFRIANPPDVLFGVYPADNDSGEFSAVLPHVVFSKPTFPWTRYPTKELPHDKLTQPGSDVDADVPAWLAVLLLDEDDLPVPDAGARPPTMATTYGPKAATIRDLLPNGLDPKSTLEDDRCSYFHGLDAGHLNTAMDVGDALTDPIQVLDLPLSLFWQIAPSVADLKLLAHVRQVSLFNKPTNTGARQVRRRKSDKRIVRISAAAAAAGADPGEPVGEFAIVVGNRFPQTGKRAHAFLVSLEHLEDLLPASDGTPPKSDAAKAYHRIRLAVLKSWSFFSYGSPATFRDRLLGLNGRNAQNKNEPDAGVTTLRLPPYQGSNPVAVNAIAMGYVPLNHDLRTTDNDGKGEQTVSWYRGPLVPYPVAKARVALPIASPDQALMFDPTTGLFDASYAAAWTLGRMLALQDKAFSVALYGWKKGLERQVVQNVEDQVLQQELAPMFAVLPQAMALPGAQHPTFSRALVHKLLQSLQPRK
jgi:hypothetical protein